MINIAGAFNHYKELLLLILKYKKYFKDVTVYDGVDDSPWNGGRINKLWCSKFNQKYFETYNNLNIGVYLTFSNSIIDTSLEHENDLLRILNNFDRNGVIIANHNLNDYIHTKYPNLKTMLSVTYFKNLDINVQNLKFLETQYNYICPRYEWVFNSNFYQNINVSKYKIMLNDTCKYNCKLWHDHFEKINEINRSDKKYDKNELIKIQECWLNADPDRGWSKDIEKYKDNLGMDLSENAIQNALNIGYRHFKICGRDLNNKYVTEIDEYLEKLVKANYHKY